MNTSVCETPPWNLQLVCVHSAIGSKSTSPHPWPKQRGNSYLCMNLYKQSVWTRGVPLRQASYGWLEKAMAPPSSSLAWKIPWMEEPGRLWSKGSLRVGHDWVTSLSLFTLMHWRRKWQPTPVFLPGESQGRGSLVGWHLWGRTESDTTEVT